MGLGDFEGSAIDSWVRKRLLCEEADEDDEEKKTYCVNPSSFLRSGPLDPSISSSRNPNTCVLVARNSLTAVKGL